MNNNFYIKYDDDMVEELDRIYFYIKEGLKEPEVAKRFIKNIESKIKTLAYFPSIHKLLRKTKNFEYRKFIIKNYIIIYKINIKKKEINILHIYNQKQKINKKMEEQVY